MIRPRMGEAHDGLAQWSHEIISRHVDAAGEALAEYCAKPKSVRRLHGTRKRLARLRAVIEDFGRLAGVSRDFADRVRLLQKRAGKARDADVLLQRVEAYRESATGAEREELDLLRKRLRKRAERMRRKLAREIRA